MIVGILLAAGNSRRFGAQKLLHPLADGTPLGVRSAHHLRSAVDTVVAVVSPQDRVLPELLRRVGTEVCLCARSDEGMGASLACGVAASAAADGWVIALADMPFIQPATIDAVAQALREGAAIAAPVYGGTRGQPVGFGRQYGAELRMLAGDEGARAIVNRERAKLVLVSVDDPGVHRDVDTRNDLGRD